MSSSYFRPSKNTTSIETRSITQAPPQAQTMSSDNQVTNQSSLRKAADYLGTSAPLIKEIRKEASNKQVNNTVLTLIDKLENTQKRAEDMLKVLSQQVCEDRADKTKALETMLEKLDEDMKSIKESWNKEKK
ncbi:hypothetical protein L211DRAFT_331646 [Terfezia boudieri ATCC MYA-4762]|uniref:Uncharacterized protein n=1 Tax=Terfezia boudieri ATCC MYA-4762 TaxID=1051890 RepID=A0A3N4LI60_9PEZI|nr:hypothetical protein L211DRAFT_331646 [Terfezia boudieri ATCC MYA-4762]